MPWKGVHFVNMYGYFCIFVISSAAFPYFSVAFLHLNAIF